MKIFPKKHPAFTLLELVFVIVILGIVASIGSQTIVQVYESYASQKAIHNASIKTELAINQLANRLTYRIDRSMLARAAAPGHTGLTVADVYPAAEVPLPDVDKYPILEWIGYDVDSLEARKIPAWSGYCDLNNPATNFSRIATPGSKVDKLSSFSYYGASRALVFAGKPYYRDSNLSSYKAQCMYTNSGCIFGVSTGSASETLRFTGTGDRQAGKMRYTEFYRLANSAFAVVPTNKHKINTVWVWDLKLYYGYHPWDGDNYLNGKSSVLLRNVSVFRFRKEMNSIRIKLCSVEQTAIGDQMAICKEKAVIR